MYKNSEKFLTTFTRIERMLKTLLRDRREVGFSKAVKILSNSNPIVKRYSNTLLEFAELRNAIVHNKIDMTYAIAEPHDSVVNEIEIIEKELMQPRKVIPLFSRKVYVFQQSQPLASLLKLINEKDISKFPIYDGGEFKGIVSQKGITSWLAKNAVEQISHLSEIEIRDVLSYEKGDNFKLISSNTSVYEAEEIFKDQVGKGNRLEALLITKHGHPSEKLLGIITNWDIMKV
ncbi:hypothetical protein CWR48_10960 [Oceanobacillus arenosus]|uniref:CBS domain-containing protein n=1 Tax=Oceanobacillus arenosus TaxID=1229153 RepID=A0A3D8PPN3_9BACI|nr:CBS domain-containing protein [Oceanobacillus arenosus]RDW18106.1 hypothetical protein CWR48_10960 [Oceanobacillus arenosus]